MYNYAGERYPLTRCFGRNVIDKAWPIGDSCLNLHDENCIRREAIRVQLKNGVPAQP